MTKFTNIYDGRGKKIAESHEDRFRTNYYDPSGRFMGSTTPNATRDGIGRIVANKPFGGLLFRGRNR